MKRKEKIKEVDQAWGPTSQRGWGGTVWVVARVKGVARLVCVRSSSSCILSADTLKLLSNH